MAKDSTPDTLSHSCPRCGSPAEYPDCENCGHDFTAEGAGVREGLMAFTIWPNVHGLVFEEQRRAWPDLCELVRAEVQKPDKHACRLIKLATFGNVRSAKGNSLRHDPNVRQVTGIEGDYDAGGMRPDEALELLERHLVRALVYTSASHTSANPRWRVLAPLSTPIDPAEREGYAEGLNGMLGGVLARESATLSQAYFFGPVNGGEYRVHNTFGDPEEGFCLDEIDDLDLLRRPFSGTKKEAVGERTQDDYLGELLAGDDVHGNALRIIGRLVREGVPDSVIRGVLGVLSQQVAERRGTVRARELMGAELDRMIAGAREKGFTKPPGDAAHGAAVASELLALQQTGQSRESEGLSQGEWEELTAWSWSTGRKLDSSIKPPRVSLGVGNFTAPWVGIAVKAGSADRFLPGVEDYLPRRMDKVEQANLKRMERGQEPQPDLPEDALKQHAAQWLARVEALVVDDKRGRELAACVEPARPPFRLVPARDLLEPPAPLRWLVRDYLPPQSQVLLFGDPAAGKSLIAIDWAACIATGRPWCDHPVSPSPVVYIAGEGHFGIRRRLMAWGIHHNALGTLKDAPLYVSEAGAALVEAASVESLVAAVDEVAERQGPPGLVVLDTIHRNLGPGDENSAQDIAAYIKAADSISKRYGGTVLHVHHSGHADKGRSRGSSAIRAAVDAEFLVEAEPGGHRTLSCPIKMKDAPRPSPWGFEIQVVELPWMDAEEQPEKSVVLSPAVQAPGHRITKRPTQTIRRAFEALCSAVSQNGITPPEHWVGPANLMIRPGRIVTLESWRTMFYAVHPGDSQEAKKKAFQRVRSELVDSRSVGHWSDTYWPTPEGSPWQELVGICAAIGITNHADGTPGQTGQSGHLSRASRDNRDTLPLGSVPCPDANVPMFEQTKNDPLVGHDQRPAQSQ